MRLGVFGGTFDPIHMAHLIIVEWMRVELLLDRVLIIPASKPPHKNASELSEVQMRMAMVRLAIADHPFLEASDIEIQRASISYTVETLFLLAQKYQLDRKHLFLLLGGDSLNDLHRWHQPEQIFKIATVVSAPRPGVTVLRSDNDLIRNVIWVDSPLVEISATQIRERVRQKKSIRYLVPAAVEKFIIEQALYL